nr:MAG TPA: hypothetical protein [Caudoviricetes sp.]
MRSCTQLETLPKVQRNSEKWCQNTPYNYVI